MAGGEGTPAGSRGSAVSSSDLVEVLEEIATLLEIRGENDFKISAYRKAARAIESGDWDPIEAIIAGTLGQRKGFGEALVEKLTTLVRTGTLPFLDTVRAEVPADLVALLAIPGLGAKRLGRLHRELGVVDAKTLREGCADGRVATLKGFGPATARRILDGLDYLERHAGLFLLLDADAECAALEAAIAPEATGGGSSGAHRILRSGALARRSETVRSIELLGLADDPEQAAAKTVRAARDAGIASTATPSIATAGRACHASFRTSTGFPVVTVFLPRDADASHTVREMSGPAHWEALVARAEARGLLLDATGLSQGGKLLPCADEESFYARLGLPHLPPELREDEHSITRAEAGGSLALVDAGDLRGYLHVHTTASDGKNTLEEMAEAIAARGGEYFGVCDHSQASHWAGGLTPDEVRSQHAAIDAWNAAARTPRILKGIEADILPDGRLDYDDAVLATFDFVVASVHINFQMSEPEMTRRVLAALDNPRVDILGHPTGRLLLERPGYPIDLDAVAAKALERDVILEINANPHRLDLSWDRARRYRSGGLRFSINTDAHAVGGLDNARFGIDVARRAGIGPSEVLNALPLEAITARFQARRSPRGPGPRPGRRGR